jgi:hypothetical protein
MVTELPAAALGVAIFVTGAIVPASVTEIFVTGAIVVVVDDVTTVSPVAATFIAASAIFAATWGLKCLPVTRIVMPFGPTEVTLALIESTVIADPARFAGTTGTVSNTGFVAAAPADTLTATGLPAVADLPETATPLSPPFILTSPIARTAINATDKIVFSIRCNFLFSWFSIRRIRHNRSLLLPPRAKAMGVLPIVNSPNAINASK